MYLRDQHKKTPSNRTDPDQYSDKHVSLIREAFPDMYKDEPQKQLPDKTNL